MIRFEGVAAERGGRRVLEGISCVFPAGALTLLLGRSGSGKSTLLRLINRMTDVAAGRLSVEGLDQLDVYALRRRVGFVPQNLGLFPHRRVEEQLRLAGGTDVARSLASVDLPVEYARRYPRELSGGEQQRVAIARALASDPPVLLLDEAFSALDPILRRDLSELVARLGKTTILASHDAAGTLPWAQQVVFLEKGRLLFAGTPEDFGRADDPLMARYREASRC